MTSYLKKFGFYREPLYRPDGEKEEDSFSPVGEFFRGVSTGVDQLQALGGGAVGLIGDAVGFDSMRDLGIEIYQDNMAEAQETAAKIATYKDVEGVTDAIEYAAHGLGTLAPTMAATFAGGGIGAFVAKRAANKGLKSFVEKQIQNRVKKGIAEKVAARQVMSNVAQLGAATGAFGASATIGSGSIYGDIFEKTGEMRPGVAAGFGAVVGALDAMPAFRILRKFNLADDVVEEAAKKIMPEVVKQAGAEGLTESAQTIVERAAVNVVDRNRDILGPEGMEEIINAGILGAIGGGVVGGGVQALTREPAVPSDRELDTNTSDQGDALDNAVSRTAHQAYTLRQELDAEDSLAGRVETMLSLFSNYGGDLNMDIGVGTPGDVTEPQQPSNWRGVLEQRQFASGQTRSLGRDALDQAASQDIGAFPEERSFAQIRMDDAKSARAARLEQEAQEADLRAREEEARARIEAQKEARKFAYSPEENTDAALLADKRNQLQQIRNEIQVAQTGVDPEAADRLPELRSLEQQTRDEISALSRTPIIQQTGVELDTEGLPEYEVPQPKGRGNARQNVPPRPDELPDLVSPEAPMTFEQRREQLREEKQQSFTGAGFRSTERTARQQQISDAKREVDEELRLVEGTETGPLFDGSSQQQDLLAQARRDTATSPENDLLEPTEAQKEAGNYRKGKVNIQGMEISLENPKGSTRSGTDRDGNEWSREMQHDYGYIRRTRGADDTGGKVPEQLDVFIGDNPDSDTVYVIDQYVDGEFDEHKAMVGFTSEKAAREAYQSNYDPDWDGLGAITPMSVSEFKQFAYDNERTKAPVAQPETVRETVSAVVRDIPRVIRESYTELSPELTARQEASYFDGVRDRVKGEFDKERGQKDPAYRSGADRARTAELDQDGEVLLGLREPPAAKASSPKIEGKSRTIARMVENDPDVNNYHDEPKEQFPYVIEFDNKADDAGAKTLIAGTVKEAKERYKEFTRENEVERRQFELKEDYVTAYEKVFGEAPPAETQLEDVQVEDVQVEEAQSSRGEKPRPAGNGLSVREVVSGELLEEIEYQVNDVERDGEYTDADALNDILDTAEANGERAMLRSARKAAIKLGWYRPVTDAELAETQTNQGKAYDFQMNKTKYVWVGADADSTATETQTDIGLGSTKAEAEAALRNRTAELERKPERTARTETDYSFQDYTKAKDVKLNPDDDITVALSKLGGLNREVAEAEGFDPEGFRVKRGRKSVFTKYGGLSLDGALEQLNELGFNLADQDDLVSRLNASLNGVPQYARTADFDAQAERDAAAREQEMGTDRELTQVSPLRSAKKLTGNEFYTSGGMTYEFEVYDDGANAVVYAYDADGNPLWDAGTSVTEGDRVIDVVRNAEENRQAEPVTDDDDYSDIPFRKGEGTSVEKFTELGNLQRDKPERAMLAAQEKIGGGVLAPVIEHAGDLVHRATHMLGWSNSNDGFEFVQEKVKRLHRALNSRYGFEKEMRENFESNADFFGVPVDQFTKNIDAALQKFANEHAKLPAYNTLHEQFRDLNVALGEQRWGEARQIVNELNDLISDRDAYAAAARENLAAPSTRLGEETDTLSAAPKEVQEAVANLRKQFGDTQIRVFDSVDDLPDGPIFDRVREQSGQVKGFLVGDTAYVISREHDGAADVERTVVHEIVGHYGIRKLLGDKAEAFFREVYETLANREGITRIADRYGLDLNKPKDQIVAAEEYVAHLSEASRNQNLYQRVKARIRAALRKMGLVWTYTDDDIRSLLMRARGAALREGTANDTTDAVALRLRLGEANDGEIDRDPEHPRSIYNKISALMGTKAQDVGDPTTWAESLNLPAKKTLMKVIPLQYLPDFVRNLPALRDFVREIQKMDATKERLISEFMDIVKALENLPRLEREALAEVQNESTIAQIDPSKDPAPPAAPGGATQTYNAEYKRLKDMFDDLSPEAQRLYGEMRDAHVELQKQTDRQLLQRLARLQKAQEDKGHKQAGLEVAKLRKMFELQKVPEPYFPLYRHGPIWVSAVKGKGKNADREFVRFETWAEAEDYQQTMESDGYEVKRGLVSDQSNSPMESYSPELYSQMTTIVRQISDTTEQKEIQDALHQAYLMSLPETSMRKHKIHRKNRKGYNTDILRGFSQSMFHGSHQLARLTHLTDLERHMEEVRSAVLNDRNLNKNLMAQVIKDEMQARFDWAMNPRSGALATSLNRFGFMWYLGATPAAALVNFTQTPMVALPVMAAKPGWGWKQSTAELGRAMQEQQQMIKENTRRRFAQRSPFLEDKYGYEEMLRERIDNAKTNAEAKAARQELDAYTSLLDSGSITKTQSHDLSGLAELGDQYTGVGHRLSEKVAAMFHNAEVSNREITGIAAYRMARQANLDKGMDPDAAHDAAVQEAHDVINMSHFDFSNANRAPFLQNDFFKVAFLFKQHSLNMTYRLTRDFVDMMKLVRQENPGIDREVLYEARRRFTGMIGMTGLFTGLTGMPMFWAVKAVANAMLGDEDEPYDFEAEFRAALAEAWSPGVATAITKGPISALSGADVASRTSLNDMWFRDPRSDMDAEQEFLHYTGELLGPVWKIPLNALRGAEMYSNGYDRGLENVLPKAMRDVLKSIRYQEEGVRNFRGDPIIAPEDMDAGDIMYQLFGFSPEMVSTQYEQNRAIKNAEQKILTRRQNLLTRYALAARAQDPDEVRDTIEKIRKFNAANPRYPLTSKTIKRSMKQRARYTSESLAGVNLNKNLHYLADELKFTE